MNDDNFNLVEKYVSHGYVQQGREARRVLEKNIRQLLEQGKIPSHGWNDLSIKHLLQEISLMDSNNFPDNCGVGEREARIASQLVAQRHFYLGHGIGRSGDVAEIQPKAAGSSLLAKLANSFALDVIKMHGVQNANSCLLVPVATGMALVLTMLTLKESRVDAKYVIWPRIDQKSCFKSILTSGLEPLIIENILNGDQLETDISTIKTTIEDVGKENVLCVLTTTSCFAPRVPDKLEDVAFICKENDIPHVVNNAYGVQSSKCMHLIQQASRCGRVDAFVQSTDKNFMVPVGGAIIAGFDKTFIQSVGKMYPGRASASPIIDFFITMLSLGDLGYKELLKERKELYTYMKNGLQEVAEQYNERCMDIKQNQISLAVTLRSIDAFSKGDKKTVTEFGSYLFKRAVSGTRVVPPNDTKTIGKYSFKGWGAHTDVYPCSYFTAAAAIGTTKPHIDKFLKRLDNTFKLFIKDPDPAPLPRALKRAVFSHNDLRQTKSLTEKTHDDGDNNVILRNRPGTFSSYGENNVILRNRPSTFSSYETSVSTWPKAGRTRINNESEPAESGDGTCFSNQHGRHSDSSLVLSKDYMNQLILPGEIPPDKMSFLIDI